ncbi:hypothetical protein CR513_13997, partial [Mucuna pruriens]
MGSSRMQIGRLRANNSDDHHTGQIQIKGCMQLKDSYALEPKQLSTTKSKTPGATIPPPTIAESTTTSNLEFQQTMSSSNLQFQRNMSAIVQDLKMQSARSKNLPSQTIPNPRRNASIVSLRSGREFQAALQQKPRSTNIESKPDANSQPPQ